MLTLKVAILCRAYRSDYWNYLLNLPAKEDIGKAINDAMKDIEAENEDLKGVLPKTYKAFDKPLLIELLKSFNNIPMNC